MVVALSVLKTTLVAMFRDTSPVIVISRRLGPNRPLLIKFSTAVAPPVDSSAERRRILRNSQTVKVCKIDVVQNNAGSFRVEAEIHIHVIRESTRHFHRGVIVDTDHEQIAEATAEPIVTAFADFHSLNIANSPQIDPGVVFCCELSQNILIEQGECRTGDRAADDIARVDVVWQSAAD